jgi:hypothetical protein
MKKKKQTIIYHCQSCKKELSVENDMLICRTPGCKLKGTEFLEVFSVQLGKGFSRVEEHTRKRGM